MDNIEKKELLVKPKVKAEHVKAEHVKAEHVKAEHLDKYYSKEFLKTYFK